MNHSDHRWEDCPELYPPKVTGPLPTTGFLDPTDDQMNDARRSLRGYGRPEVYALNYVGAVLNRFAAGNFDSDSVRRAVAMYRVWEELEASS